MGDHDDNHNTNKERFLAQILPLETRSEPDHCRWLKSYLDKYVRAPINKLIEEEPTALPELTARLGAGTLLITVGDEALSINRREGEPENGRDETPDDAVDKVIG
jgi:hypothetical protein